MSLKRENTEVQLTFFPVVFPVKIFLSPEEVKELTEQEVDYGRNTVELFRSLYLDMSSLKTHLRSRRKASKKSFMTFTKSGMMQNGKVFSLPNLGNVTKEKDFTSLPTPMYKDGEGYYITSNEASLKRIHKQIHWIHSAVLFYDLPKCLANPRFSEWMMGLPKDWTQLKDSEVVEML